jgi:hypothetical protein
VPQRWRGSIGSTRPRVEADPGAERGANPCVAFDFMTSNSHAHAIRLSHLGNSGPNFY